MTGLTIDYPAKFEDVLKSARVIAGDTIILRAGTYSGDWISQFSGTAENPIIIQPYNDEAVTIEGSLGIQGEHTHWNNINFHNDTPSENVVLATKAGTEFSGCDFSGGFIGLRWFGSGVGKVSACAFHDTASYGIYTHNNGGGLREILNCTFVDIGGYYSLHMYSESENKVKDYLVQGNTFDKVVVVHGPEITNVSFLSNTFYSRLKLGNGTTVSDIRQAVVRLNTFNSSGSAIEILNFSDVEITDNSFAVSEIPNLQSNIAVYEGANKNTFVSDRNQFTGGWFNFENNIDTFQNWQSRGYDLNSSYS